MLDAAGIQYRVNQRLVRGLDYYNRTVFEWVTTALGSQGTVCAGGRYDGLVGQLGGKPTPAVGFAMGMERMVLLVESLNPGFIADESVTDVYLASFGENSQKSALLLAEQVRDALPNLRVMTNHGGGNFKKQLARADKQGAKVALILGEEEIANHQVGVKDLRTGEQETVSQQQLAQRLAELLG